MRKVVKFGGSSLASAEQFKKVGDIIRSDSERKFVVPSAPGKRNSKDTKVTDMLYACYEAAEKDEDFKEQLKAIKARYEEIISGLSLTLSLDSEFKKIDANFKKKAGKDYAASRGEYLNGIIMAHYLKYTFVDAAEVIFFDENGDFDAEKTNKVLSARLEETECAVVPGFYGALPDGTVHTFSRGGSDITGSLAANAVNADVYENWTDVSGILMADPRIVDHPQPIRRVTYDELRELAYMGASVLHDESIQPVKEKNIPLNIRNTNDPQDPGTMIVERVEREEEAGGNRFITGITGRKGFTVLTIHKKQIALNTAVVRLALEIFENFHVPVEHITLGVDSFTIMTPTAQAGDRIYDIIGEIRKRCQPDDLRTEENIAMIACVGRKMVYQPGTCGKLFGALGENAVNIKAISQGTNEISILVGVHNRDFEKAIRVLYNGFVA